MAYGELAKQIENEYAVFVDLESLQSIKGFSDDLDAYTKAKEASFCLGFEIDKAVADNADISPSLQKQYLLSLRALEPKRSKLRADFLKALRERIEANDEAAVLAYLDVAYALVYPDKKMMAKVYAYIDAHASITQHSVIEQIKVDQDLDVRSEAFSQRMHEEYQAYQAVIKAAEAQRLRQMLLAQRKGGVIVSASEDKGDILFEIENLFAMHVSASLFIRHIQGYETKEKLPLSLVLKPKEQRFLLRLKNSDVNGHVGSFDSHVTWVKGSVDANENRDFIYALPFKETQRCSQGYNGRTSHRGNARYAVDFAMDIGTPVLAARSGKVVEVIQKHNRHGMALSMREYANYVIIEHDDHTLGRYFHLKQNSVKVKVGDEVKQGEVLALSGDTGRTSGPHLHFVVTKAKQSHTGYESVSIPVKFACARGLVDEPKEGESYQSVATSKD